MLPASPRRRRQHGDCSAGHGERLLEARRRAVAGVDVDLAGLDHELAAVVVEAEVALVEREA